MNDKERLKIILDNSIYDHNFEEFTVPLKDMDWLIQQAERVGELEENCSHLRKSFQRQRSKAVEGWEKVGKLEKENYQAMTRVHQLASIATDHEREYKDLQAKSKHYQEVAKMQDEDINRLSEYNRKLCLRIGRGIT